MNAAKRILELPRRRRLAILLAVFTVGALVAAGVILADAPDPVPSSTHSTNVQVDTSTGQITVTIAGSWQWTTHHSNCNNDKRGVGFAVDWNDPSSPGNLVTTLNNVKIDVGTSTDNVVHPAEPGTDVSSPSQYLQWRGGCGTFNSSLGYNTGTWGPISHTYPANTTTINPCVLMYDVHLQSNGGAPNGASEITAGGSGHNGDNSAQKNSSTPLGNGCFTSTFHIPTITTTPSAGVQLGGTVNDVATLSNTTGTPGGSITFRLFGPSATPNCSTTPVFTDTEPVSNGSATSANFQPASAGTYYWTAQYSGDNNGNTAAGPTNCGDESVVVTAPPPQGFLKICKQADGPFVSGSFAFTFAGQSVSVPVGGCSDFVSVSPGQITVTEGGRSGFVVTGISASPSGRLVSSSLSNRTATVTVVSGDTTTATVVTFTNKRKTGFLEICKAASDEGVTGTFTFKVAGLTVTAPVGGCSSAVVVPSGQNTITEAATTNFQMTGVSTIPSNALVSKDLTKQTATVSVVASNNVSTQTVVTFKNGFKTGTLKICKVAGSGITQGTSFSFTANGAPVSVQAGPSPGGFCTVDGTYHVGTHVTIVESIPTGDQVSAITVNPSNRIVGTANLGTGTVTITIGTGFTDVTYTNQQQPG